MANVHLVAGTLKGQITAPPSKSVAHRALICAALCKGHSTVTNIEYSADMHATLAALEVLGAKIKRKENSAEIEGIGGLLQNKSLPEINSEVNCIESGSTLRFMVPLFALAGKAVRFTGAKSLYQRPLTVYEKLYKKQGILFEAGENWLNTEGKLQSGEFVLAGNVSSQFITGLLFVLPLLQGDSVLEITPPLESRSYIELTRNVQAVFGVQSHWQSKYTLCIKGGQEYISHNYEVEGDWSQAAVLAVLAAVCGNVSVAGLDEKSAQGDKAILNILQSCGAQISFENGILKARKTTLQAPPPIDVGDCPDLGPILCALALFCKGTSQIVNAGRLRIKESDRIAATIEELSKMGAEISSTKDSITIKGGARIKTGVAVQSHQDHRLVMMATAVALCAGVNVYIEGAQAVNKSWPSFFDVIKKLGAEVHTE